LQLWPQIDVTSPTHVASQATAQQYGSWAQSAVAHASHPLASAPPVAQVGCAHVLGPASDAAGYGVQLWPQIDATSPTHVASHSVLQQ
jgi:hypothetical protein